VNLDALDGQAGQGVGRRQDVRPGFPGEPDDDMDAKMEPPALDPRQGVEEGPGVVAPVQVGEGPIVDGLET